MDRDSLWPMETMILLSVLAGVALPLQSGVNAELGKQLGNPLRASIASFCIGTGTLVAIALVTGLTLPPPATLAAAPWWSWLGGLIGAFFVTVTLVMAPRLGAANLIVLVICGQILSSLAFDHFGWMGYAIREITWTRLLGATLVLLGVYLVKRG